MIRKIRKNQLALALLLSVFALLTPYPLQAQQEPDFTEQQSDTLFNKQIVQFLLKNPSSWIQNNINKLNTSSTIHPPSLDTVEIINRLQKIDNSNGMIRRNLEYNSLVLRMRHVNDLKNELLAEISDLQHLQKKVVQNNNYLLKEVSNTMMIQREIDYFYRHADSAIISIYKPEIELLDSTIKQTNNYYTKRLMTLVRIEDSINLTGLRLQESNRYVQSLLRTIDANYLKPLLPPIWESGINDYPHTFVETIRETIRQTYEAIMFFLKHNVTRLILYRIVLFIIALLPVHYFRKHKTHKLTGIHTQKYLQKYPTLSSVIMGLAAAPLIFSHAPYAFLDFIFISLTICVSIIYIKEHSYISRLPFYIILVLLIILTLVNFFTSPTFAGRIIYSFSILILLPMYQIYRDRVAHAADKRNLGRVIYLLLMIQLSFGWGLIILGYYPQGRQLFLGAIDAFVLALILSVTVFTFIDYLRILTFMINKKSKSIQIDHEIIEKKLKRIIIILAGLFFIVSYLKNLNLFDEITDWLTNLINQPRQLGDSVFTFGSILLFIGVAYGAIYIANLINLAIETEDYKKQFKKRTALGSTKLIVRFIIITVGFIIGIIASGIPLTQITVLMGALGVGIGFGLQNIFNNLVSGLIIAIEKPVSVGDMVELGKDTGWIKEIGIRASNMQTFDGAEVIVPNGELISNRLTNWTLSNKRRRLEITVGVAYKSDPHQVNAILSNVLENHPEILKLPEPGIFFNAMSDNSLVFVLNFWISDFVEGKRIRSEVLYDVFDALKENGIEIPFPQRD
ncbi:MAG: mechanosensitive ion channel family protein, partial [Bacteroidales bacterium]